MVANHASWVLRILIAVAVALLARETAWAELVDISARCESTVVERLLGDTTRDSAVERYPETTSVLPMRADAGITSETSVGFMGIALSLSQFKDPRNVTAAIPDELNLDAAAYSADAGLSYDVMTQVIETRRIRPTAQETGLGDGEEVELVSSFYIQGLLVVLAKSAGTNLNGLVAQVEADVTHERPGHAPETVMTATYALLGRPDGTVEFRRDGRGDPSHASEWDLSHFIDEVAMLRLLILPAARIEYTYTATVGTESKLEAKLDVSLVTLPGGTGAGAAFGMPGQKIGQVVGAILGDSAGTTTVQVINNSIATLPPPAVQFLADTTTNGAGLLGVLPSTCSLFGIVLPFAFALMLYLTGLRPGRR